jgi:hypothetical protein
MTHFDEESFFDICGDILTELGELEAAHYSPYRDKRGIKLVDGYGGDPRESDGLLSLVIVDFLPEDTIEPINDVDIDRLFARLKLFIWQSLKTSFRESWDAAGPGFGIAECINTCWATLKGVNLIIVTNRQSSSSTADRPAEMLEEVRCTFSIWDIQSLRNTL